METQALVKVDDTKTMTKADLLGHIHLIQGVMESVMKQGTHYGTIPGTPKPSLWKPGAEVLCLTFRLGTEYEILDRRIEDDFILYDVKCTLYHIPTGNRVGSGIGSANSREGKYHWRSAISDEEFMNTPDERCQIKHTRDGKVKQVRVNPFDVMNTIEKMGAKRALIAAVLNATAASDIFTQDVEDMPREVLQGGDTPKDTPETPSDAPVCEKCGKPMVVRKGSKGAFLGCSGYRDGCRNTKPLKKVEAPQVDQEKAAALEKLIKLRADHPEAYEKALTNMGTTVKPEAMDVADLSQLLAAIHNAADIPF